jgi:hypothetical protein
MPRAIGPIAVFAVLSLAAACGSAPESPEDRLRAVLASIEEGAEANDAAALKRYVSEHYGDPDGRDKQALAGVVAFHLLRNQSVHLFTRVGEIDFRVPGEARADVLVAMAGSPIPSPEVLPALRADLYRFELRFRDEEGHWRLSSAAWRPAAVDDFR